MPEHHISENPALESLLGAIKEFRDRVTRAGALISDLRRKNEELEHTVSTLELTVLELQEQVVEKQAVIDSLRARGDSVSGVDVSEKLLYLSPDEREALERQINDLIDRINIHLG